MTLNESIEIMTDEIVSILSDNKPTIYLYGSAALDDFKLGWSDIDIIVLNEEELTAQQADYLVGFRQTMLKHYPGNSYFRLFEGAMLSVDALLNGKTERIVYWGTSGQRIVDTYSLDSFAIAEILDSGILLFGNDIRDKFSYPTHEQFKADIHRHLITIREHGTDGWGWLLDIARGIYTIQTGKVIAKTLAGEWALEKEVCPVMESLKRAVEVRKFPLKYKNLEEYQNYAKHTGDDIQQFADVLEKEIMLQKQSFF